MPARHRSRSPVLAFAVLILTSPGARADAAPADVSPVTTSAGAPEVAMSDATGECITCHEVVSPGIVADWRKSRHSRTTMSQALGKLELERRVSVKQVPEGLADVVVGCAECHTRDPEKHPDTIDHEGYPVHTVVTPVDCAFCHPVEVEEYSRNVMSHARDNLDKNPLYHQLKEAVAAPHEVKDGKLVRGALTPAMEADSCDACHGTEVKVTGKITRETDAGEMEFAVLSGWPNQGVGRVNPDGSRGTCSACHTRHAFSIEMARRPETCGTCHKGPDSPAYLIYESSKHGSLYASLSADWDFQAVPWVVGKHFTSPTCATCHMSLITTPDGEIVARRTHRMNDRLPWRLFGAPYSHPHPVSPETYKVVNKQGLSLMTELTGEPVAAAVIDQEELEKRQAAMKAVCRTCHSSGWTDGHFTQLERTIEYTNQMVRASTDIVSKAWELGLARGIPQGDNPFDEPIERLWTETWLFHANAIRMSSAMAGPDYGTFAGGRFQLSQKLCLMQEWLESRQKKSTPPPAQGGR